MSNTSAQTASTIAKTVHTAFVAEYALNAHLPIIIFRLHRSRQSTFLKSHIVDGRFLFGIHLLSCIYALLLKEDRFNHNSEERDDTDEKYNGFLHVVKYCKTSQIGCRDQKIGDDKACARDPNYDRQLSVNSIRDSLILAIPRSEQFLCTPINREAEYRHDDCYRNHQPRSNVRSENAPVSFIMPTSSSIPPFAAP